ncbi:MAG: ligand-binding sensor domain-containing protein, partial [Vicinamibacteraceae bacterium]
MRLPRPYGTWPLLAHLGRVLLCVAAAVCLVPRAQAQAPTDAPEYGIDVWTTDNGLPQNIVRAIHQARDGYLWLTTLDGLVRFDGVRFTTFDRTGSPGIASNRFTPIYESADGALWIGSETAGVTRYHDGTFTTYGVDEGLRHNNVAGITGDGKGNVWVLAGGHIARWQDGHFRAAKLDLPAIVFQNCGWSTEIFWGVRDRTLYHFTRGRVTRWTLPAGVRLTRMEEDPSGTLWVTTQEGTIATLTRRPLHQQSTSDAIESTWREVDGDAEMSVTHRDRHGVDWRVSVAPNLSRTLIVPSSGQRQEIVFTRIHEDREGNLWLGTDGRGLYRVREQTVKVYSEEHGLIGPNVYPVFQDHNGAVWIGARSAGLSRLHEGRFTSFTTADGLPSPTVTALAEDGDGRLWLAALGPKNGGLARFEDGRFVTVPDQMVLNNAAVAVIHHAPTGAVWLGTTSGLIRYEDGQSIRYTTQDGLAGDDVKVIIDDRAGGLWVGAYGGLTHVQDSRLTSWTEDEGLPSNSVRSLYLDPEGVLWIGTYDGGLGRLEDGRMTTYTVRDGLFNNGVFQILDDQHGHLWMSCNRGLYRVSTAELNQFAAGARTTINALSLGRSDGLLNPEANGGNWPAGIRARDGRLWFPTQDGVAVIDPASVTASDTKVPAVIESVLAHRAPVPFEDGVRLASHQNTLEIRYTGLSFENSPWLRFRYRLNGLDEDWVEAGRRRTAYYSHVPPGEYTFAVLAANSDGVWNTTGASLSIVIVPRFYQTRWFWWLVALAGAAVAAGAYRRRVEGLKRARTAQQAFARQLIDSQERERGRIAAELHDSLGQQLLIIKNRALLGTMAESHPDEAKEQFDEISTTATRSLDEIRQIARDLRPYHLDRLGLTHSIEDMVERISASSEVHLSSRIAQIDGAIPKEQEINLYR